MECRKLGNTDVKLSAITLNYNWWTMKFTHNS
jgi:hypothetical protein